MPEQLKVGVIGAGNMGRHHIRNYSEMPETDLVGLADPDQKSAKLAEEIMTLYYERHEDMFEDHELDAVSIAVPTPLHYRIAKDAIEHGIHTLIEKPIASTVEEGYQLIELAEQNNVTLSVGHIERYNPVIDRLKTMIDSGQLGDILSVESRRIGGFPANEPKTDVIADLAVHDIDILNHLLGAKGEIRSVSGHQTYHSTEIDSAEVILNYNGVTGIILANWITPIKIREIVITASKGYVQANYINQEIKLYEPMEIVQQGDFAKFVKAFGEPTEHIIRPAKQEPMRRQLGAFVLAATTGNRESIINPRDAVSALEIALDAADRIKGGKHVS